MREVQLNLKLMAIMERNRLPGYVLDHLTLIREIIQRTLCEVDMVLGEKKGPYSTTA
jgi:hypothetical protein